MKGTDGILQASAAESAPRDARGASAQKKRATTARPICFRFEVSGITLRPKSYPGRELPRGRAGQDDVGCCDYVAALIV